MPKISVYLPDDLYLRAKGRKVNISKILRVELERVVREEERAAYAQAALAAFLDDEEGC